MPTTPIATSPTETPSDTRTGSASENDGRIVWRRLLQRKLLIRVTLPTAIGLVQLALSIIAIVSGDARPMLLLFMLPALAVGFWFGRRTMIAWDDERAQVSLVQAQILLAISYIVVRIGTHYLLELTLSGRKNAIATAVLLVSFGLFFGRSAGLAVQIWQALTHRADPEPADALPARTSGGRDSIAVFVTLAKDVRARRYGSSPPSRDREGRHWPDPTQTKTRATTCVIRT